MSSAQNIIQLPNKQDIEQAKQSSRTLSKYTDTERVHLKIRGRSQESDELVLPNHVVQLLLNILSEMAQGNAISVMPIHAELTTQEAANILNVSRPHLVKLVDNGKIPFHKVGTHRRVLAQDVLDYKKHINKQRHDTLDELTALSQEMEMGYE
jgi:excisionase family DNA binding protein